MVKCIKNVKNDYIKVRIVVFWGDKKSVEGRVSGRDILRASGVQQCSFFFFFFLLLSNG